MERGEGEEVEESVTKKRKALSSSLVQPVGGKNGSMTAERRKLLNIRNEKVEAEEKLRRKEESVRAQVSRVSVEDIRRVLLKPKMTKIYELLTGVMAKTLVETSVFVENADLIMSGETSQVAFYKLAYRKNEDMEELFIEFHLDITDMSASLVSTMHGNLSADKNACANFYEWIMSKAISLKEKPKKDAPAAALSSSAAPPKNPILQITPAELVTFFSIFVMICRQILLVFVAHYTGDNPQVINTEFLKTFFEKLEPEW